MTILHMRGITHIRRIEKPWRPGPCYRTAKGELYGRPNGTPPVTVCTGFK